MYAVQIDMKTRQIAPQEHVLVSETYRLINTDNGWIGKTEFATEQAAQDMANDLNELLAEITAS